MDLEKSLSVGNSPDNKNEKLSLPRLVLYTQTGSIPFLSWNFIHQFEKQVLFQENQSTKVDNIELIKLNVGDFMDILDDPEQTTKPLNSMKYFQKCSMILSQFDPLQPAQQVLKSTNDQVPIVTIHGKKMLSVDGLLKLCACIGVEHCQTLADIITPQMAKKKWTMKSVNRSIKFFDDIVNYVSSHQNNSKIKLWATVTGGFIQDSRLKSCEHVARNSDQVEAVIIDGLNNYYNNPNENDSDDSILNQFVENFKDSAKLLRETVLPNLPGHLPKVLFGTFLPDDMLRLIHLGIDILDTSICTVLTQQGLALPSPLIFEYRFRFSRSMSQDSIEDPNPGTIIDLKNAAFSRSKLVLSKNCQCYTCLNGFTRAYMNHLLKRKEINVNILLQIHNHFTLTEFFHQIRAMKIENPKNFDQLLVNSGI